MGLFADMDFEEGHVLGRMSGIVCFESECVDTSENWALAQMDERMVLLRANGRWLVVDVRGSVFEFANCSVDEESANIHVSESGWVTTECDVEKGTELVWWYGSLHAASMIASDGLVPYFPREMKCGEF